MVGSQIDFNLLAVRIYDFAKRFVPTLMLADGTTIGEVPAIWRYLDEAYPERPLLGATAKDKALIQMWERRMELEGFVARLFGRRRASGDAP